MIELKTPLKKEDFSKLRAGDIVLLSGTIITARDQAHKRAIQDKLDIINGNIIYYTGSSPEKDGSIIGSCGPTSSYRMDKYYEDMLNLGMIASIGKGKRSEEVINLTKQYGTIYFIVPGGLGALISQNVIKKELLYYPDLLAEAIYELEVKDLKLIVGIDSFGNSIIK